MANIRRRGSSWQVQIRRNGFKPITKSFLTKVDADRWAREQEAKIDRGGFEDVGALRKQTVKGLLEKFLKEKVPGRKGKRWETVRINALVKEEIALRRLDQDLVGALQDWAKKRSKNVSAATVIRDLTFLSTVFRTAIQEWRLPLSVNPVSLVKRPVVDKAPKGRLWSSDDLAALRAAQKRIVEAESLAIGDEPVERRFTVAADFVLPALELSIETAMRRGELCGFTVDNVHLAERRIWLPPEVTKTGVGRNVLLSTRAVEIVKELLEIPRRAGEGRVIPVEPDTLGLRFRQLRNAAGLKGLRLHDGRHTAATRASKVFDNVLELAAFTGHQSLQTLKRYYHPDATELAKRLG